MHKTYITNNLRFKFEAEFFELRAGIKEFIPFI